MAEGRGGVLRAVALALAIALLSPVDAVVLAGVPLGVMLVAFGGGRLRALIPAALLLGLAFAGGPGEEPVLWYAERAWALLLAGGFVVVTLVGSRGGTLARAGAALGIAFAVVGFHAVFRPDLIGEIDWWIGGRLNRAALMAYQWVGARGVEGAGAAIRRAAELQVTLYPALLGLASLGALGLAWHVAVRVRGWRGGLPPLREFRFSDQLVWVLIGGLILFLLPVGQLAARLGENAMAFMGGLYLLRGMAVIAWVGAAAVTSAWSAAVWGLLAVLLYPLLLGAALVIGIGDTWLDLRRRLRPAGRKPE